MSQLSMGLSFETALRYRMEEAWRKGFHQGVMTQATAQQVGLLASNGTPCPTELFPGK